MSPDEHAVAAHADTPVVRRLLGFTRLARDNGFRVGVEESLDALRIAETVGALDPSALRWGLRTLLCASADDWARFDALFDVYWYSAGRHSATRHERSALAAGDGGVVDAPSGRTTELSAGDGDGEGAGEEGGRHAGASARAHLSRTDFRHISDRQALGEIYALTERMAARMRWRLTRRYRARRRGRQVALRRTIHASLRYGGTPLNLVYRARRERPVRLVVLLDASGSMSLYSAFFVRFVRGIVENFADAEAFVFHTRLVHLSDALREKDIDKAMERMAVMSQGWGGGTRIGECLEIFNRGYADSVLGSRSVVMILSDGYDTGTPELLARQMARLRRRARRVVWLNPLLGWQGYEPVARGMSAALPHIDLFAPAHNLESLAALEPWLYRLL